MAAGLRELQPQTDLRPQKSAEDGLKEANKAEKRARTCPALQTLLKVHQCAKKSERCNRLPTFQYHRSRFWYSQVRQAASAPPPIVGDWETAIPGDMVVLKGLKARRLSITTPATPPASDRSPSRSFSRSIAS